jgi:hypothetical protein
MKIKRLEKWENCSIKSSSTHTCEHGNYNVDKKMWINGRLQCFGTFHNHLGLGEKQWGSRILEILPLVGIDKIDGFVSSFDTLDTPNSNNCKIAYLPRRKLCFCNQSFCTKKWHCVIFVVYNSVCKKHAIINV